MNAERFALLASTYGADLRRWPTVERDAAQRLVESGDTAALAALAEARALDATLDTYDAGSVSAAFIDRIIAAAPAGATWTWTRARLWWSGAGLAGLGLAGAALGALMISIATPVLLGGDDEVLTAFGQIADLGFDGADSDVEGALE